MKNLKYLQRTAEMYGFSDPLYKSDFNICVTEDNRGLRFELQTDRIFSRAGIEECISILQAVIANDCYSPFPQKGEEDTKILRADFKEFEKKLKGKSKLIQSGDQG